MALRGIDPEPYITEYTLVYEETSTSVAPACQATSEQGWILYEKGIKTFLVMKFDTRID